VNSSAICATEDDVWRLPARFGRRDFVFQQPPSRPEAAAGAGSAAGVGPASGGGLVPGVAQVRGPGDLSTRRFCEVRFGGRGSGVILMG